MKFLFLTLFFCGISFGQQVITGKVIDPTGEPLIGATILEEGTSNQVQTDFYGSFAISIEKSGATILILAMHFETLYFKTFPNKNDYGDFILEENGCNLPIKPHLNISANSGLLNNPYGIDLGFWNNLNRLKNTTRISTQIQYQTNFNGDYFFQAGMQLYQIQWDPNYSINIKGSFEKIEFQDAFKPIIYSVEGVVKNANNLGVIAGGKLMRLNSTSFLAPTIGLTYDNYLWSGFSTTATVSFFNGNTQYIGRIAKDFGRIATFINYYKIQQFDELSIGLGYTLYY
ncbi:carboxypeptidase-like regulatory domain-containing protein [Nonlabens ulvanivorans]|uniref:carboxypeptidase-like regulatory domain-containing protein n=1 Tax=Nonlabens ulvanivorans TaxID=906888 RepID=UPI0029424610|nr:carboxypeptidase-like regulatory domain-containing protein [Nonlabens ulvanivorans]WOI22249.1 carboxypeptidase-like regulatory domain-containing protein [Nonlabens ulvanivorans]